MPSKAPDSNLITPFRQAISAARFAACALTASPAVLYSVPSAPMRTSRSSVPTSPPEPAGEAASAAIWFLMICTSVAHLSSAENSPVASIASAFLMDFSTVRINGLVEMMGRSVSSP